MSLRELIQARKGGKHYVRRVAHGQFAVPKGQGDRGEQKKS